MTELAWVDAPTLAKLICHSETSIETLVAEGKLPPARKPFGRKRLWDWKEVDQWIRNGPPDKLADLTERVRRRINGG